MKEKSAVLTAKKTVTFLAAAAVALSGICLQPIGGIHAYAVSQESDLSGKGPYLDPITIDHPMKLSEISLPESLYGTWAWADAAQNASKSYETFTVYLKPAESSDLSWMEGWDAAAGVVKGTVDVCVSNPEEALSEPVPEQETPETASEDGEETPKEPVTETTVEELQTVEDAGAQTAGASDGSADMAQESVSEISDTDAAESGSENDRTEETNGDVPDQEEAADDPAADGSETVIDNEHPGSPGSAENSQNPPSGEISTETSDDSLSPEQPSEEKKEDHIFDQDTGGTTEDTRPVSVTEGLTEEEELQNGLINHTSCGITVTGEHLPWYVQFRVSEHGAEDFYSSDAADIFKAYDFVLWDLKTDAEYTIPEGSYVSFQIPVKEGYDYLIEHILPNGARETIEPTLLSDTLVFSTGSLSPFGVAGSKTIVGEAGMEENYPSVSPTGTPTPVPTRAPSSTGSSGTRSAGQGISSGTSANAGSSQAGSTGNSASGNTSVRQSGNDSRTAVSTGDESSVFLWISAVLAAMMTVIFAGLLILKRKA